MMGIASSIFIPYFFKFQGDLLARLAFGLLKPRSCNNFQVKNKKKKNESCKNSFQLEFLSLTQAWPYRKSFISLKLSLALELPGKDTFSHHEIKL